MNDMVPSFRMTNTLTNGHTIYVTTIDIDATLDAGFYLNYESLEYGE